MTIGRLLAGGAAIALAAAIPPGFAALLIHRPSGRPTGNADPHPTHYGLQHRPERS